MENRLVFYNPDIPLWGVVLLWPLQAAIATGCIIAAALFGERLPPSDSF